MKRYRSDQLNLMGKITVFVRDRISARPAKEIQTKKLMRHIKSIGIKTLVGVYLFSSVTACALRNEYTVNNVRLDSQYYADSGQVMTDGTAFMNQAWWKKYWKQVFTAGWIGLMVWLWWPDSDDNITSPACGGFNQPDCPDDPDGRVGRRRDFDAGRYDTV